MSQPKLSREEIQKILDGVSFQDRKFLLIEKVPGDVYLIQMSYMEPDVEKPGSEPVEQKTRKWYVSTFMSESEIVETCWAMVQRSMLHIASEYFTYRGRRVYSQHFDVQSRMYLCDHHQFDSREPIPAVVIQNNPVVPKVTIE